MKAKDHVAVPYS